MSEYLDRLIGRLKQEERESPRSQQTEIGWSEVAGCRAAMGFRMKGEWETNECDGWRATCGTGLHEYVGQRDRQDRAFVEHEVETLYGGIPGHADAVDNDSVTDYKFPTVAVSESWRRDSEARRQKMVQVHGYAAGLVEAGRLPEDCVVRLLVAPVDGTYDDWWVCEEPFDRAIADAAVELVLDVQGMVETGVQPPRDMPYDWCSKFCEFFSTCRNGPPPDAEPIEDPELAAQVRLYGELGEEISPKTKLRKQIAAEIRGLRGKAGEWRVGLTRPSGTKWVPDMAAIEEQYAERGEELPSKQVPTSAPSLTVKRVKD